jgi:hypothetical protein
MGHIKRIFACTCMMIILVALTACGKAQAEQLPPHEILARSAERMTSLAGFEFLIERSGASAFLDPAQTISFRRAEGNFVSPSRVHATVRVIAPGLVTEVQIISIEGKQWETNLVSGQWQPSDPRYTFNPALLFNVENGIPFVLAQELMNPVLLGIEELPEIPGEKLYALEASLQGDSAYQMTFGMIDKETLHIKLWVNPDTFDLYRFVLIDPADPGDEEDTTWQIDFWNFGDTFEIKEPLPTTQ